MAERDHAGRELGSMYLLMRGSPPSAWRRRAPEPVRAARGDREGGALATRAYFDFSASFFLRRSWLLWPQAFLRQFVARMGREA